MKRRTNRALALASLLRPAMVGGAPTVAPTAAPAAKPAPPLSSTRRLTRPSSGSVQTTAGRGINASNTLG